MPGERGGDVLAVDLVRIRRGDGQRLRLGEDVAVAPDRDAAARGRVPHGGVAAVEPAEAVVRRVARIDQPAAGGRRDRPRPALVDEGAGGREQRVGAARPRAHGDRQAPVGRDLERARGGHAGEDGSGGIRDAADRQRADIGEVEARGVRRDGADPVGGQRQGDRIGCDDAQVRRRDEAGLRHRAGHVQGERVRDGERGVEREGARRLDRPAAGREGRGGRSRHRGAETGVEGRQRGQAGAVAPPAAGEIEAGQRAWQAAGVGDRVGRTGAGIRGGEGGHAVAGGERAGLDERVVGAVRPRRDAADDAAVARDRDEAEPVRAARERRAVGLGDEARHRLHPVREERGQVGVEARSRRPDRPVEAARQRPLQLRRRQRGADAVGGHPRGLRVVETVRQRERGGDADQAADAAAAAARDHRAGRGGLIDRVAAAAADQAADGAADAEAQDRAAGGDLRDAAAGAGADQAADRDGGQDGQGDVAGRVGLRDGRAIQAADQAADGTAQARADDVARRGRPAHATAIHQADQAADGAVAGDRGRADDVEDPAGEIAAGQRADVAVAADRAADQCEVAQRAHILADEAGVPAALGDRQPGDAVVEALDHAEALAHQRVGVGGAGGVQVVGERVEAGGARRLRVDAVGGGRNPVDAVEIGHAVEQRVALAVDREPAAGIRRGGAAGGVGVGQGAAGREVQVRERGRVVGEVDRDGAVRRDRRVEAQRAGGQQPEAGAVGEGDRVRHGDRRVRRRGLHPEGVARAHRLIDGEVAPADEEAAAPRGGDGRERRRVAARARARARPGIGERGRGGERVRRRGDRHGVAVEVDAALQSRAGRGGERRAVGAVMDEEGHAVGDRAGLAEGVVGAVRARARRSERRAAGDDADRARARGRDPGVGVDGAGDDLDAVREERGQVGVEPAAGAPAAGGEAARQRAGLQLRRGQPRDRDVRVVRADAGLAPARRGVPIGVGERGDAAAEGRIPADQSPRVGP
ncbi:hypothetical protein CHKEEEPN_0522 [Methylorubrum podarium]|nr:hypothetical protein CHKEEEPN_0522 [Methylorubrum podarium]